MNLCRRQLVLLKYPFVNSMITRLSRRYNNRKDTALIKVIYNIKPNMQDINCDAFRRLYELERDLNDCDNTNPIRHLCQLY